MINAHIEPVSAHRHFFLRNAQIPPNIDRIPIIRSILDIKNRIPEAMSTPKSHPSNSITEMEMAILKIKNKLNPISVKIPEIILNTPAIIGIGDFVICEYPLPTRFKYL